MTDKWTDRNIDGQTDVQTETGTYRQTEMDGNLNSKMHFFLTLGKMHYPTSNIKDGILLFNCKQWKTYCAG